MESASTGLTLGDDLPVVDWLDPQARVMERLVRGLLAAGFLAVLALEAYLIVEGLRLL